MAFNIIGRDYKYKQDGVTVDLNAGAVCDIVCDTAADLPTADDISDNKILPGSWCWLIAEKNYAVLNTSLTWVQGDKGGS